MNTMRLLRLTAIILLLVSLTAVFSGCAVISLPPLEVAEASKIYGANNQLITTLFKENRVQISIDKIPKETQNAFIAVEDARFYKHFGLDPVRIAGAIWNDLRARKLAEGASTITQQTARNLYLSREKTFGRKLQEAWYAILLERKYSKKQILEIYLNQIYFGQGAYGIETAAQTYFGKPASQLDLAESAMLAGLPKAPSNYSPFANWDAAKSRQKTVLNRMVETGFINQEQAARAAKEKLILNTGSSSGGSSSYYVNEVIKYITDKYEDGAKMLFSDGISVYTTLDPDMQQAAEKAFDTAMSNQDQALEGALVAVEPQTGYIKAMVGGRDFARSKFNRAVQAKRQPGSAFKPFLYTAAIDKGYTQATTLTCEPVQFPQGTGKMYKPTDYGQNAYHNRPFTLREALAVSDNVVAVKLANEIGPAVIVDYAHRMGIKSDLRSYLSLALGTSEVSPLELTSAYGTLAAQGMRTEPILISKITEKNGQVIEENLPKKTRVLSETTAYLVTDMLLAVLQPGGTAGSLSTSVSRPAAGKTGTTQNYHDAWFVGYTPDLVAGVYIGYDNPNKSVGATGGKIAAPIWAQFITKALRKTPPAGFPVPAGITQARICADSGLLATEYSSNVLTASFLQGTEPKEYCNIHTGPGVGQNYEGAAQYNGSQNPSPDLRQRVYDWFFRSTRGSGNGHANRWR